MDMLVCRSQVQRRYLQAPLRYILYTDQRTRRRRSKSLQSECDRIMATRSTKLKCTYCGRTITGDEYGHPCMFHLYVGISELYCRSSVIHEVINKIFL